MELNSRSQGADVVASGIRYRTWAPGKALIEVLVYDQGGVPLRKLKLTPETNGYFSVVDSSGQAGDQYAYRFQGREWPDPASRYNPFGVHGRSMVINPADYVWHDRTWVTPPLAELIIYELHIGTFSKEGTFRGAIDHLDHIRALGANAVEIMPIADFDGSRNWGYDGVSIYAPARCYGVPDDLRMLVDAAHGRGIAVILDVVYNHLGPAGNYLAQYSADYFNPRKKARWGDALNYAVQPVRRFFLENPVYWRREFHIDGFRLDATHAIRDSSPSHFLADLTEEIHASGALVIAEDDRREPKLLQPVRSGGFGLDGCWADDFHHAVRVMLTGEREGYYQRYQGTAEELRSIIRDGWLLDGKSNHSDPVPEKAIATDPRPEQFVFCISNHDQIGNHPLGVRLSDLVSPGAYRAASALLCLLPHTPLFFMGQEWASSSPFQYFTDHEPDLGQAITEGRRHEFRDFSAFSDPVAQRKIPDPQAIETFERSKLRWDELAQPSHTSVFELYQECLRLRRECFALQDRSRTNWKVLEIPEPYIAIQFGLGSECQHLLVADLVGNHGPPPIDLDRDWKIVFSSNDRRFSTEQIAPFEQPEVQLWRAV